MITTRTAISRAIMLYIATLLFGLFATSFCAPTPAPPLPPAHNTSLSTTSLSDPLRLSMINKREMPNNLIVFNPTITSPKEGDVWMVGTMQVVTWETDNIPPAAKNTTGMVVLGYYDGEDEGSEHLDNGNPLAGGFPLDQGQVSVMVPNVQMRTDYIIVLFGDSGNASPQFTIKGTNKLSELEVFRV